jgi:pilus assembly protein CpaB
MNRKWIGVVVAVVLAAVGTWVLVQYVQSAEERALEGQETIEVLVVSETVPAGVPAETLTTMVRTELVPAKVQAPGSIGDLEELEGQVTAVELLPGEQVISNRFVTAEAFAEDEDFELPDGLVEVTMSLSPERAVGGALRPGDQVAVFASFEPFEIERTVEDESGETTIVITADDDGEDEEAADETSEPAEAPTKTPNTTGLIIHKVLVSNVQVEQLPVEPEVGEGEEAPDVELAPTGNLLVTLAMEPEQAERFVFTAEFGLVWLAGENDTVLEDGTQVQTRGSIYDDPVLEAAR